MNEIETVRLNKKNIPYISRRSGKSVAELEVMRQLMKDQGRTIKLQYVIKEN